MDPLWRWWTRPATSARSSSGSFPTATSPTGTSACSPAAGPPGSASPSRTASMPWRSSVRRASTGSTSPCSAPAGRSARSSARWRRGSIVVDNSSAFRMVPEVPLVIPGVNPEAMAHIKLQGRSGKGALIANPNCFTIVCLMAATPLHRHAKAVRMVVSTYQAASSAGVAAMEELAQQTHEVLEGKKPTCKIFKQQNDMDVKVTATLSDD
ncbi:aspartate-semialdehyde dehydrogenase, partial [Musa troglodytarum]